MTSAGVLVAGVAAVVVLVAAGGRGAFPAPRRPSRPAIDRPVHPSDGRRERRLRWWRARRSTPPGDAEVAAWCDELARRCRSGDSLTSAVRRAPAPPALTVALGPLWLALDRGVPLHAAVGRVIAAPGAPPPVVLALEVVRVGADVGGPVAQPLDRAAATLRLRVADAHERDAHSAQARWSARVLTVLPVGVLALLAAASPSIRSVTTSAAGFACVAAGTGLNLAGWRWMRRIVGRPA